ncbi:TIGR04219 family outer membrane beta-barrel protein [Paraferrimonas haliotis]|uniref:TIGR04219 family outer membrane beta-barrel protein n=1 Tax=Paraferrimonas haliotis TaxID=2013866 RepID=UPI000BA94584|nr:TIGR04219 family outer membrane beta-barrel protein [Paraferrimonas haliotis]
MKKLSYAALAVSLGLASASASADVIGFKVGGDYWKADSEMAFADAGTPRQTFETDSESQMSLWLAIEHPVPILPNVMIRENRIETKGYADNADMRFDGQDFTGGVTADVNLSNTDFILYYELLDNDLIELDLGGAYKRFHSDFAILPDDEVGRRYSRDLSSGVAMAYARSQVKVPGFGLYGFVDVMTDGSKNYDYQGGVGWIFDTIALDYKLRVGYREMGFEDTSFDSVNAKTNFKGAFAGIELHF